MQSTTVEHRSNSSCTTQHAVQWIQPFESYHTIARRCRLSVRFTLIFLITCPTVALLFPVSTAASVAPECIRSVEAGAGSCPESQDITSVSASISRYRMIGNPVDPVSANKYQPAIDFLSSDSALQFSRHYNSNLRHQRTALGAGWRHTYDVRLLRVTADLLQIQQGDGRKLWFSASSDAPFRYTSTQSAEGYIVRDEANYRWHTADGRLLWFRGPFLLRIDLQNGGSIRLKYKAGTLSTISDEQNKTLQLRYSTEAQAHRLTQLILPNRTVISYHYNGDMLAEVSHPDNEITLYHYEDNRHPRALTGVSQRGRGRLTQITYDAKAQPVELSEFDTNVKIKIDWPKAVEHDGSGNTRVTSTLGESAVYRWRQTGTAASRSLISLQLSDCASCTPRYYGPTDNHQSVAVRSEIVPFVPNDDGGQSMFISPKALKVVRRDQLARPIQLEARNGPAVGVTYSMFGPIRTLTQYTNTITLNGAVPDDQWLKSDRNRRASRFAAETLRSLTHDQPPESSRDNSACLGWPAEQERINTDLLTTLDSLSENSVSAVELLQNQICEVSQSGIAVQPSITGAQFRDLRPAECESYFEVYHGTSRGFALEAALHNHESYAAAVATARRFPVVDFVLDQTAVAVTSLDLTAESYVNGIFSNPVYIRLIGEAAQMHRRIVLPLQQNGYVTVTEGALTTTLESSRITAFVVELIVQQGRATAAQVQQILDAQRDLWTRFGIRLSIVEIP